MPAPASYTYTSTSLVDAHTSFRDLVDAGASNGYIEILNESDTVLCTVDLSDPCGTVNGTTGQLTFSIPAAGTATTSGTASWARINDSNGVSLLEMPAQEGTSAVSGYIVLNTLSIISGGDVDIISAVVG